MRISDWSSDVCSSDLSERQPGSSFKPFVYAAALNKGYTLATLINDAPIVVDDPSQANLWRPHNVNLTFNGPTRLKDALVHSRNLVSIRVLDDIGFDYEIGMASCRRRGCQYG